MKNIGRMVLVLALVSTIAAVLLAKVYDVTKEPIAEALRQEMLMAIEAVLPAYENQPDTDAVTVGDIIYYPGLSNGVPVGYAFKVTTTEGYSGDIIAMVGVDHEGTVTGVKVLVHAETPGLGAKFTDARFLGKYIGKSLGNAKWKVKKDGGDFDQITGATITPRALVGAVRVGLVTFGKDKAAVAKSFEGGAK